MATQRKAPARGKSTSTRKAGARAGRHAAKPARAAKPKPRPAAARPKARATAKARPPAKAAPRVIGRPAVKGKPRIAVARRGPDPAVKPLGVIPIERRDSSKERTVPMTPARVPASSARALPSAKPPAVQRLTEKDYKEFEGLLLAERQKIMKEMGHLESTVLKVNQRESAGDLSRYSFHMADAGTDAMEREKAFLLASAEGRILMEVNDALRRLYRGEFGDCEICGNPIGRARLEAMLYTRLCLACKEKEERASRGVS